jgi:hypothetical protein
MSGGKHVQRDKTSGKKKRLEDQTSAGTKCPREKHPEAKHPFGLFSIHIYILKTSKTILY